MKTSSEKSSSTSSRTAQQDSSHAFFSKASGGDFFSSATSAPRVQMKLAVGKPGDKLEQEADKMADKVMRMPTPVSPAKEEKLQRQPDDKLQKKEDEKIQKAPEKEEKVQRAPDEKLQKKEDEKLQKAPEKEEKVQRAPDEKLQKKEDEKVLKAPANDEKLQRKGGDSTPAIGSAVQSSIQSQTAGGQPLSSDVRGYMEPRFGADFSNVRVHNDAVSANLNTQLSARAFTYQNHVFFSGNQYQPGTSEGKQLLAHELTHTIQQGHAVQRSPQVSTTTTPVIQRFLGIKIPSWQDVIDWLADKAYNIPGYRMFTIVIGANPINGASADRSAANILRAIVEFLPGGKVITDALQKYNVFAKAGTWVEGKLKRFSNLLGTIKSAVKKFMSDLKFRDVVLRPGRTWDRAVNIFTQPVKDIITFIGSIYQEIFQFIRDAVLMPLAALAEGKPGFDLLCALLGKNPITKKAVPRTPDTIIGGFMKFIGQEEIWENIKKGKAVARAWTWFQTAMNQLVELVSQFPENFINMLKSLEIMDFIILPNLFIKVFKVFGNFALSFGKWALSTIWDLLEIIFDVVKPGIMVYIRKTGAALKSIIKNPLPFVGNLVRAAKLGFNNFRNHFGAHLKAGLIDWLTGSLSGVYIPKALSLPEMGKFAMSVLGITWAQIRGKIVKVLGPNGETIMKGLETGFDIVVALITGGPAAAWELIKEKLTDLKDQVVSGIIGFVTDTVITKAIPKLIAMFIPGAGFITAIISIYDTVMVFVQKISKIIQVVVAFIDSIVAIAGGNITVAAKRVENILAGLLSLAISFLAGFAGLGKVTDKIQGVIEKVRASVDKAIDAAIEWIVTKAKALFGKFMTGAKKLFNWWKKKLPVQIGGDKHTLTFDGSEKNAKLVLRSLPQLPSQFLEDAAKKGNVPDTKSKTPIKEAKSYEKTIKGLQDELGIIDDNNKKAASNKSAQKADDLMAKLDTNLDLLSKYIVATLVEWKVSDVPIKGVDLPRGSFTFEQKKGIAEQHPDQKDIVDNSKGQPINLRQIKGKELARRHVVSAHDMGKHYEELNGKKMSEGKLLLEQRGSISDSRVPVDEVSQVGIQKAAKTRYSRFFGYLRNMFIGNSLINSTLQERLDKGHPKMDSDKLVEDHVRHIKRAWAFDQNMKISR